MPSIDYRVVRIPKGRGRWREIYVVENPADRLYLRSLLPSLRAALARHDKLGANYAFERGKNCALHALQHVGFRYTLSMDLEDCFGSVRRSHVEAMLSDPPDLLDACFVGTILPQGFSTSPLVATLALLQTDQRIHSALARIGGDFVYTRYADDLVVSFNDRALLGKYRSVIAQAVLVDGFSVNRKKTRFQDERNGRRVITGIAIDSNGLHATRKTRRKIRAAIHQGNRKSFKGLTEWEKCALPSDYFE